MIKRLIVLFLLPIIACRGSNTTPPSTPTSVSGPQTSAPPTAIPATATLTATQTSPTEPPPNASTFPDPNSYTWQQIAAGLIRPVDLQDNGSGRLFILEKAGRIRIFENGQLLPEPFLDIDDRVNDSSNEMGLLGLAFHPDYAQNGFFYVNYTGAGGNTFISRFQANGNSADPNSETNLLKVDQPFPNHNGGVLTFGPDGYLYAGLGDGGGQGDPFGNAQNLDVLLGKILRIDVNSPDGQPYAIPPDNPFGKEILHYGLRNPWRISFDKMTGDLYIADVGQGAWEEIDFVPDGSPGGLNFGWDFYEGNHDYDPQGTAGDYVFPVAEYSHDEGGCSVTGGYVYRGSMPEWNGIYLYGDYCTGYVWGLINVDGGWQNKLLFQPNARITSFGQDKAGEIYMVSDTGEVYKLIRK
jgi:glucose/arabinose dehydrogenase